MKTDRVTLRADDAILAFTEVRASIQHLDELIAAGQTDLEKYRTEKFEAYQRIAKALGVKPTLSEGTP